MAARIPLSYDLIVDELGYIWTQRYNPPDGAGSPEWQVFADTGTGIGTVTLPVALSVMEVSADAILGVYTDDLGRQDVREYSLDRRGDTDPRPLPAGCG